MPWNPDIYNQFKNIRYQPFFDLKNLIDEQYLKSAIDIGCGTGEQTKILSETFQQAHFLGIDTSKEMLSKSKEYENERLQFKVQSVEDLVQTNQKFDLVFSNAALHWSHNHQELFPKLISLLSDKGQIAIQMPVQNENILNKILYNLANEEPFKTQLNGFNIESPVLSLDDYSEILYENGLQNCTLFIKVYPLIAEDAQQLFNFISGSALIPYLERLSEVEKENFSTEFKNRIQEKFKKYPAIYPFKRLLMYAKK